MRTLCLILTIFLLHGVACSQNNLSSLTGNGRPSCSNPDSLAKSLRSKCEQKVSSRLGKKFFRAFYDRTYLYPHYYQNVYFNNAPGEKNYRVFLRLRPLVNTNFDIEIEISQDTKKFIYPISEYLPDCKAKPSECICMNEQEVMIKGNEIERELIKTPGHTKFGYDAKRSTFIWTFQKTERLSSTRGHTLTVVFDANDLSMISKQLDTNVWMGRCLGKGTLIDTPSGLRAVEGLTKGDTILARNEEGAKDKFIIKSSEKRQVIGPFQILVPAENTNSKALISPAHPDENGIPYGKRYSEKSTDGPMLLEYREDFTYDILSTAPDGGYYCGEIYLRSTIQQK